MSCHGNDSSVLQEVETPTGDLRESNHVLQFLLADTFAVRLAHFGRRGVYLELAVEVEEQTLFRLLPRPIVVRSISLTSFRLFVGSGNGPAMGPC